MAIAATSPPPFHIRSLPSELIEEILILSTVLGSPTSVAAFSQTCRAFHDIVYRQFHKHLWREMFLTLFDDPRMARDIATCGAAPPATRLGGNAKGKGVRRPDEFPWEEEYKRRIWTARYIRRRTDADSHVQPPSTPEKLYRAVQTLLRVITSAAPLPSASLAGIPPSSHPHPVFPPLSVAAHTQPELVARSRNIEFMSCVLSRGFPKVLKERLSAFSGETVDVAKPAEIYDGLLYKLVAQTGLMEPISRVPAPLNAQTLVTAPLAVVEHVGAILQAEDGDEVPEFDADGSTGGGSHSSTSSSEGSEESEGEGSSSEDGDYHPPSNEDTDSAGDTDEDVPSAEEHHNSNEFNEQNGIRRLARIRVYNMSYLHHERRYGPFLSVVNKPESRASPPTPTFFPPEQSALPPSIPDSSIFISSLAEGDDDDAQDLDFEDEDDFEAALATNFHPPTPDSARRGEHADALQFDWAWVGAARQVIELNLRDLLMGRHHNVLRALMSLEGLRACSAPGYLEEDMRPGDDGHAIDEPEPAHPQVGGDGRFAEGEGWDWAGVEGQWRRCVCWLDYRDLIGNNVRALRTRFSDPSLFEVMRIIPVNLRVVGFSAAPAAWPGRPTIHVEGNIAGQGNPQQVRGTVAMVAGGDIRWSLFTLREDSEGEWQSEGVQLGGVGSAAGVIGMWTGSEHEQMDPLGPFWQWKVGPTDTQGRAPQTVQGKALQLRTPPK